MKYFILYILLVFLLPANISIAQNSIFAGKIVDEHNRPLPGATIRVSENTNAIETRSDADGLFYTRLIQSNTYHIDVIIGGKYLSAKRIYLPPQDIKKVYYLLKVVDNKLLIRADGVDPFLKSKLSKVLAEPPVFDVFHGRTRFYISVKDSASDRYIPVYGGRETTPSTR